MRSPLQIDDTIPGEPQSAALSQVPSVPSGENDTDSSATRDPSQCHGELVVPPPVVSTVDAKATRRPSMRIRDAVEKFGRYHLLRTLGEGGMGEVRLAYDPVLERKVALKTLRPQWRIDGEKNPTLLNYTEQRLKREARALAHLDHPLIVKVLDVGVLDGILYIAMELVDGKNLRSWAGIDHGEGRDWRVSASMMLSVGRALASAHDQGVVHRDFKPENVVVDGHGRPFLIDFGIALHEQESSEAFTEATRSYAPISEIAADTGSQTRLTRQGNTIGTPAYMAPEQRLGNCDAGVDQFAYCVSFFELLYGRRPFTSALTGEESSAAFELEFVPDPGPTQAPRWLLSLLAKGMRVDARRRHPSMAQLCDAIEHGLARWNRRWWRRGWMASAMSLALLIASTDPMPGFLAQAGDSCSDVRDEWTGVWDQQRASEIQLALLRTGSNNAAETWSLLRPRMDQRVDDWVATRDELCRAHQAKEMNSDTALDSGIECLRLVKARQVQLLDMFARADVQMVHAALDSLSNLPHAEICLDAETLQSDVPWPHAPEQRRRVVRLRSVLEKVKASLDAGRSDLAKRLLDTIEAPIRSMGFTAIEAEYELQRGHMELSRGRHEQAQQAYRRTVELGGAAAHRRVVAQAAIKIMYIQAYMRGEREIAQESARLAESALVTLDDNGLLRSHLANVQGGLNLMTGDLSEAEALFRELVETLVEEVGEMNSDYHAALANHAVSLRALGRPNDAMRHYELAVRLARGTVGTSHPSLAKAYSGFGIDLVTTGHVRAGLEASRRAVDICNSASHASRSVCVKEQQYLVRLLIASGRALEAEKILADNAHVQSQYGRSHPDEQWAATLQGANWLSTGHGARARAAAESGWRRLSKDSGVAPYTQADALRWLAEAELAQKDYERARARVGKVLELVPNGSFDLWLARIHALRIGAEAELGQGRVERARELASSALEQARATRGADSPRLAPFYLTVGATLSKHGEHTRALAMIGRALELQEQMALGSNHTLTPYLIQQGSSFMAAGNPRAAASSFQRALEVHNVSLHNNDLHDELVVNLSAAQSILKAAQSVAKD